MSRRIRIVLIAVACVLIVPITAYAGDRFNDVPDSSLFHDDIAWLAGAGVTLGCNPPANDRFCPSDNVTRQQMAAFMRRLAEGQVVDAATAVEAEHATDADTLGGRGPSGYLKPGDTLNAASVAGRLRLRRPVAASHGAVVSGVNTQSGGLGNWVGVYGGAGGAAGCCIYDPAYPPQPAGVLGNIDAGQGFGVVGRSGDMEGDTADDALWQPVGNVGVVGFGSSRGVYASSRSSYGVYGTSLGWYGLYGRTSRPDNNYGLYTPDNLFSANINMGSGTIATVMQNTGDTALEPGDVVVFSGLGASPDDTGPVPAVAMTSAAGDPAVAGVVQSRFDPEAAALAPDDPAANGAALDPTPDGAAAPGSYVLVVVSGPAQVNATAEVAGALTPGEQVTTGAFSGHVAGLAEAALDGAAADASGAILGKVLGTPEDDPGALWIYVTVD